MTKLVIDPRDFVTPPFKKCPKCGGGEFGVLIIGGSRYTRRCRDRNCWHTESIALPEIRKNVIYIDQFAISNMMKAVNPRTKGHERAAAETFWRDLFESLDVVCKLQLVVCPDSDEHRNESLLSPFYQPLKRIYEHFSHGASFYDSETIRRFQVTRLAEAWIRGEAPCIDFDANRIAHGRLHEWQDRLMISVNTSYDDFVETLREQREKVHEGLLTVFVRWQTEKKTFDETFFEETMAYGPSILQAYVGWMRQYFEVAKGLAPPDLETVLPPTSAYLITAIQGVFSRAGIPQEDVWPKTVEFLQSDALVQAPFNRIAGSLFAVMARKAAAGQKEPPNRGTAADVNIVSTLLPYCDAIFVDNKCRALLNDIPKTRQLPYETKIFSPNIGSDFLSHLKEIKDSVSGDHVKLIDDVYGPDWTKPYTEILARKDEAC